MGVSYTRLKPIASETDFPIATTLCKSSSISTKPSSTKPSNSPTSPLKKNCSNSLCKNLCDRVVQKIFSTSRDKFSSLQTPSTKLCAKLVMLLIDTSVWISFFRERSGQIRQCCYILRFIICLSVLPTPKQDTHPLKRQQSHCRLPLLSLTGAIPT